MGFVTFPLCPYLLHVEPHVQYLKMKFCSFGSRYAGTGGQLEKTQRLFSVTQEDECYLYFQDLIQTNGNGVFSQYPAISSVYLVV